MVAGSTYQAILELAAGSMEMRDAVIAEMDSEQVAHMVLYVNKGTGWLFVTLGGLFLAARETVDLREHYDWPPTVFWLLVVVMFVGCVSPRSGSDAAGGSWTAC